MDENQTPKTDIKPEIQLDNMDRVYIELLSEKGKRIEAERARLDMERAQHERDNNAFVAALNQKYSVNFADYVVYPAQGIAKHRSVVAAATPETPAQ